MQKEVKIIGFELKEQMGILAAHKLIFNTDNKLTVFKGGVGQGKTTEQKAIQLATQGSKTLVDKKLYGDSIIDAEVQLLDGEMSVWVGCKSNEAGKLTYTLYTKDSEGKIVKDPVIDGVKATPAKYLELLQTELTWRMDELTSENPSVQKKILLSLYQHELTKLGVILDKKHPDYKDSILGQIEAAENVRNEKDSIRKQKGGIADDLKAKGFDPDRPATIPDAINIESIDEKIREQEKLRTIEETKAQSGQAERLQRIKADSSEVVNKCMTFNNNLRDTYNKELKAFESYNSAVGEVKASKDSIISNLNSLVLNGALDQELVDKLILNIDKSIKLPKEAVKPENPLYFEIIDNKLNLQNIDIYTGEAKELMYEALKLKEQYFNCISDEPQKADVSKFNTEISRLNEEKTKAIEINKIVEAVDSFHAWRQSNEEVVKLKNEYVKMLAKVDTGVEGLRIVPQEIDDKLDIFLMYNGAYDPDYFKANKIYECPNCQRQYKKNENKCCDTDLVEVFKHKKLSSYSDTQKPFICLLIQNYLLSKKPKAMRYMFIDKVPMDNKSVKLLNDMCDKLNLRVILNITGDFTQDTLKDGEILIENGEIFF